MRTSIRVMRILLFWSLPLAFFGTIASMFVYAKYSAPEFQLLGIWLIGWMVLAVPCLFSVTQHMKNKEYDA